MPERAIHISEETAEYISKLIASGKFASPEEVVEEGVRMLEEDSLEPLCLPREEVLKGKREYEEGRYKTAKEVREYFREKSKRLRAGE